MEDVQREYRRVEFYLLKKILTDPAKQLEWDDNTEIVDIKDGRTLSSLMTVERQTLQTELACNSDFLTTKYIDKNDITEFHLDGVLNSHERWPLLKEIFKCTNLVVLSLKQNSLESLPPDVGRLHKLEYLALTNNHLRVETIPFTLTFCASLKTLLVDRNKLDALPGFILDMKSLETVRRYNQYSDGRNAYQTTTMRHQEGGHNKITSVAGDSACLKNSTKPQSLAFWASKALIAQKHNFAADKNVPIILKNFLCNIYENFLVCHNCPSAYLKDKPGFKVITLKNSHLGNTCVPFEHWACSFECARTLELSARSDQVRETHREFLYDGNHVIERRDTFGERFIVQAGLNESKGSKGCIVM